MTPDPTDIGRRSFLASITAASAGLAGCSNVLNNSDTETDSPSDTDAPAGESTSTKSETESGDGKTEQSSDAPGSYKPMAPKAATFEDLSYWSAHAGVKLNADTETVYQGSQSARIEGRSGSIQRKFPVPVDLSNRDLSFAVKVDKPASANISVYLYDTAGKTTALLQGRHSKHPDGWVRVNPSINQVNGDLSSINRILITIGGSGKGKKYWVDDLRFHEKTANKAQVMFTFDYITRSIYEVAFPEMKKRDIQGAVSVPTDRVGNADRLTVEELKEMKDAGWEITSMTNDFASMYGVSERVQRKRIERAKNMLKQWDLGEPAALMYPKGFCDDTTVKLAEEHHDLGFLTFNDSERGTSQSAIMGQQFVNRSQPSTAQAFKNQVRPAKAYNGLYVAHQNQIGPNADNNRKVFTEMLDHVKKQRKQGNVKVVQPSDLVL